MFAYTLALFRCWDFRHCGHPADRFAKRDRSAGDLNGTEQQSGKRLQESTRCVSFSSWDIPPFISVLLNLFIATWLLFWVQMVFGLSIYFCFGLKQNIAISSCPSWTPSRHQFPEEIRRLQATAGDRRLSQQFSGTYHTSCLSQGGSVKTFHWKRRGLLQESIFTRPCGFISVQRTSNARRAWNATIFLEKIWI